MALARRRRVRFLERCTRELAEVQREHGPLEPLVIAIRWFLERAAERGLQAHGADIWVKAVGGRAWRQPLLVFFYYFDEDEVEVESVKVVDEAAGDDDS